jgi:chromatin remodeling complex protein RSC6
MSNLMNNDEARATWEELVAIEQTHPILAGVVSLAKPAERGVAAVGVTVPSARRSNKLVRPDSALGAIVGREPLERTDLTKILWSYIKKNRLQDRVQKSMIHADAKLKPVFGGKASVSTFELTKLVSSHCQQFETSAPSGRRPSRATNGAAHRRSRKAVAA